MWVFCLRFYKKPLKFVLIGGWAAYIWTKTHKSKDIDLVIEGFEDLSYLKKEYDLRKNDSLKKYEIKLEEIDIDVYAPFFSKLAIPPEDIQSLSTTVEGIRVATPEALLVLKQGAEIDRSSSIKGEKDRIDIMTLLLHSEVDFNAYRELLLKYNLNHFEERLRSMVANFKDTKHIALNPRELKLRKKEIIERLRKTTKNYS